MGIWERTIVQKNLPKQMLLLKKLLPKKTSSRKIPSDFGFRAMESTKCRHGTPLLGFYFIGEPFEVLSIEHINILQSK